MGPNGAAYAPTVSGPPTPLYSSGVMPEVLTRIRDIGKTNYDSGSGDGSGDSSDFARKISSRIGIIAGISLLIVAIYAVTKGR